MIIAVTVKENDKYDNARIYLSVTIYVNYIQHFKWAICGDFTGLHCCCCITAKICLVLFSNKV